MSSFEELMKQVESLKAENSSLRRELQDNSSHLTKLETDAGNMKDVLTHLHSAMQDDSHSDLSEMNSFTQNDSILSNNQEATLDHNSNAPEDEPAPESSWAHHQAILHQNFQQQQQQHLPTSQQQPPNNRQQQPPQGKTAGLQLTAPLDSSTLRNSQKNLSSRPASQTTQQVDDCQAVLCQSDQNLNSIVKGCEEGGDGGRETPAHLSSASNRKSSHVPPSSSSSSSSPTEGPAKKRSGDKELYSYVQELSQERKALLQEIENEERQRKCYCEQLEALHRQADDLPVLDEYNMQTDMSRRQLDYEIQRLHNIMKENMGSSEEISQRHKTRLQRIHRIEADMMRAQQIHKDQIQKNNSEDVTVKYHEDSSNSVSSTAATSSHNTETVTATTQNQNFDTSSSPSLCNAGHFTTIATQTLDSSEAGCQVKDGTPSNQNLSALYHGSWPLGRDGQPEVSLNTIANQETVSLMSFQTNNTSSSHASGGGGGGAAGYLPTMPYTQPHQHLGTKVEMVYGLLSMLGTHDKEDMSRTLLAMSSSQDSCIAMRQSGCLPLLIQLLHGSDTENGLLGKTRGSKAARARASAALHNIVHSHPDDKRGRREARVLRLLEQIRAHCDQLRTIQGEAEEPTGSEPKTDMDHHPGPAIAALMKLSFDEEHRHAICTLGGLQAIAELLQVDHSVNGNTSEQYNITMRRYACMALTNLTFGDGTNKALLCSMKPAMFALVSQLQSSNEDLRQVAASVLRNLSWRADLASKKVLREVGSVMCLMQAAMGIQKESTMKSVLSALWNLSAHCSENKADVCKVEGALAFLVATLSYKSPSKTLSIIENGGGILRNISSHIAIREEYRQVLRNHGCLKILLKHLRSPSLTIVSNACGTLWNLSARCAEDQKALWEMGAVSMLKNLVNSKHKMISMGSAAAIKNLLNARNEIGIEKDNLFGNTNKPGLHIRKKMALEAEIDPNLSETCDNMESPTDSPTHTTKHHDQRGNRNSSKFPYMVASDGHQMYGQHSTQSGMPVNLMYNHQRMIASDMSPFMGHHQARGGATEGFTKPVSRSGSQDSVGSVHSDISHDRTRQMLLKTSQLLVGKNYGSPRHNNMSRSHEHHRSRSGSSDRSHPEHPSRIVQMMQEVANNSGLETKDSVQLSLKESHSADNTPQVLRRSQAQHASFHEMPKQKARAQLLKSNGSNSYSAEAHNNSSHGKNSHLNVSHLSRNMENLHLSLEEEPNDDERPVDFSMKYTDNDTEHSPEVTRSFSSSFNSAFRPNPQVNNYMAYGKAPKDNQSSITTSGVPRKTYTSTQKSRPAASNASKKSSSSSWLGGGEMDNPSDEQPTNFSARYMEREEEHTEENDDEQPIDFSKHYSDKETESSRPPVSKPLPQSLPHYQQHLSSMDDDQVKTFCTEGTPLNFLSTATSLTDLSKVDDSEHGSAGTKSKGSLDLDASRDETTDFSSRNAEHNISRSDSQPSDRNTASTVTASKAQLSASEEKSDSPKSSIGSKSSQGISQIPSLYSYNDNSSMSASPSEKLVKYCTEGTPNSYSRRSSLSSLHSGDADNLHKQDLTLQAIDENDSLDTSHNITLKADNINNSVLHNKGNTSHSSDGGHPSHSKTVTFDNNVQETPLMFSRCSSLGSLSSFDAHSVHSSVMSDYSTSRRTSGMVSPSELPDSPSDTMPPTPSRRRSPPPPERRDNKQAESNNKDMMSSKGKEEASQDSRNVTVTKVDIIQPPMSDSNALQGPQHHPMAVRLPPVTSSEMAKTYAEEGSPEFSCATSLSALTFDDEPVIEKDPTLKRVPLGIDDGKSDKTASTQSPDNEKQELVEKANLSDVENDDDDDDIDFDDGNDSPVSESEENMLAECIEMAMPPSSKKKMKKSTSDGALKVASTASRLPMANHIPHAATVGRNLNKVPGSFNPKPSSVASPARTALKLPGTQPVPRYPPEIYEGYDSPKNYATEGTPLNFSRATSLSDLTIDDHTADVQEEGDTTLKAWQDDSNLTDDIDISDEGDEDLLSEVIEAAMPKSKKPQSKSSSSVQKQQSPAKQNKIPVPSSRADMCTKKQVGQPRQPPVESRKPATSSYQRQIPVPRAYVQKPAANNNSSGKQPGLSSERMAEGSEGRLSATSSHQVPAKSLPAKPVVRVLKSEDEQQDQPPPLPPRMSYRTQTEEDHHLGDTMKTYAVEGTPLEFSRATSLSDLTDIHDFDSDLRDDTSNNKAEVTEKVVAEVPTAASQKDEKDVVDHREPDTDLGMGDAMKTYAVEDTPYNFSRRTSFSDLTVDSDDVREKEDFSNDLNDTSTTESTSQNITVYQKVYTPGTMSVVDSPRKYNVEGTPLNYSRTGSLSSLSFDEDDESQSVDNKNAESKEDETKQERELPSFAARKPGIQSPAIARLRTPNKPFKYQPSMHSTPMVKPQQNQEHDQMTSYAVEDTPNAYSRHSSLSSLDSNDHEGLANQSGGSGGSDPLLGASESPAKKERDMSRHDSFSSLSVESLSFEPSESENALLEECISSAMPKSNKKKKKDSTTAASGLLADQVEKPQQGSDKSMHPKNGRGPQAEKEDTKDTSEKQNQNNNNKVLEQLELDSENSEEAEMDSIKLAQTFADLEDKFAELGMGCVPPHENPPTNLCLEASNSNSKEDRKEISPGEKSVDSLETDIEKSTPSEVRNVHFLQQDITPSEKSTDSLEMSSSKISLGHETKCIIDVIQMEREMAPSDRSTDSLEMASSKPFESGESDIGDIMKESFPDMTSSLVSNITTPDKDNLPIFGEILAAVEEQEANVSNASSNRTTSTQDNSRNITAIFRDGLANCTVREDFDLPESAEDSFNMTAEEEKLLEENANIVLCELSNMVSSQISTGTNEDDEAFIQNEQISLVGSTGPSSSEVSMVASLTRPIKVSESLTEDGDSIATVIHTESFHDLDEFDLPKDIVKPKPRIVKPDPNAARVVKEEVPKSIKGGKKVYKGRPPPANAARQAAQSWKSPSPVKVVKKTPEGVKAITPTPKKTPGKGLPKPSTNGVQSKLTKQLPKLSDAASPSGARRTITPPRSSPNSAANGRFGIAKPSPLVQVKQREASRSPKPSTAPKVGNISNGSKLQSPKTSKIATPVSKSPKPSGLPKPSQSYAKSPSNGISKSNTTPTKQIPKRQREESRPQMPAKQGTFVKEEPSQYVLPSEDIDISADSKQRDVDTKNVYSKQQKKVKESPPMSNRFSDELKYKAEESGKHTPTPSQEKEIDTKVASPVKTPSDKSDHGTFTVEEFSGAWEGTGFTVMAFAGAWQDARLRRRSGSCSGSGSCSETPPINRRSYVFDDSFEVASGEQSSQDNVFPSQTATEPEETNTSQQPIDKTETTPPQVKNSSRLPQSLLPTPSNRSATSSTSSANKYDSGILNSSNSSASSSKSASKPLGKAKPVTPPRASSLPKGNSSRSNTPQGRSSTPQGRSMTPQGRNLNTQGRKSSVDSLQSRSSTPQGRKGSLSSISSSSTRPSTPPKQPTKKPTTSKIASLWKKDKKDDKDSKNSKSQKALIKSEAKDKSKKKKSEESNMKKSGTYDKLVIMAGAPDIDGSLEAAAASESMPPPSAPPPTKKLWRRTYTISDGQSEETPVNVDFFIAKSEGDPMIESATSSQDEGGNVKKGKEKRKSLWRKSKDPEAKKEKSETSSKKRFSLFRRDSSETTTKSESKIPGVPGKKGKGGIWLKRKSDAENDMNSPNGDPVIELDKESFRSGEVYIGGKPNAAVVAPFNYKPSQLPVKPAVTNMNEEQVKPVATITEDNIKEKTLTKTEMLMARRKKSNMNSGSEASLESEDSRKASSSYLVTTV